MCASESPHWCVDCASTSLLVLTEVAEVYFIMEPNSKKNASTEATILQRTLDEAATILGMSNTRMPGHLIVEAALLHHLFLCAFYLSKVVICKLLSCVLTCKLRCIKTLCAAETDNTSREGKNAPMMLTSAKMIAASQRPAQLDLAGTPAVTRLPLAN